MLDLRRERSDEDMMLVLTISMWLHFKPEGYRAMTIRPTLLTVDDARRLSIERVCALSSNT
jgi:hypothetical protein